MRVFAFIIFFAISISSFSQDTLSYTQVKDFDLARKFDNGQEFKVFVLKDNSMLKIGDTLIIGKPSSSYTASMSVPSATNSRLSSSIYAYILAGKWSMNMLNGPMFLHEGADGIRVVIKNIQARHTKPLNRKSQIFECFTVSSLDAKDMFYTFSSISDAIEKGEVINPKRPMTREQAIAKLKEAKELVDLELMSKEEYEKLKLQLTPIIMNQ